MILNSVSANGSFPTQSLTIYINDPTPEVDNARMGIRVYNYYYYNEKYANPGNFLIFNVNNESLRFPTNSASVPSDFPITWNTNVALNPTFGNAYLYVSFLGGTSGITIHPSQLYPKITKLSNNQIGMSGGLVEYQAYGYDDPFSVVDFRKALPLSAIGPVSATTFYFGSVPYASKTRRNYLLSQTKNYSNLISRTLAPNIIGNSFSMSVPIVSSNKVIDEENIWEMTVYNKQSSNISQNTGTINFAYVSAEDIQDATGIDNGEYFYNTGYLICGTGAFWLVTKPPLLFAKYSDVTVTYETSANINVADYALTNPSTNYFTVSTKNPVYFYNQRFQFTAPGIAARRDAFTVSFYPSAGISSYDLSENSGVSAFYSHLIFTDNFYQTTYTPTVNSNLAKKRFIEHTGDISLSAYDVATNILYNTNQWMPASATMRFINDGLGNRYTTTIQVSTFTGAIYNCLDDLEFILNNKNVVFEIYTTESTDFSAKIRSSIFPTQDFESRIKWSAFPPENITFRNISSAEMILPNTYVSAEDVEIEVHNLGVDKTRITVYSEEYDLSAHTYWLPSSAVYSSSRLQIEGSIKDNDPINTGTLSALINKNGFLYRTPDSASIIWNETLNPSKGTTTLYNKYGQLVSDASIYPSLTYSVIDATLSALPTSRDPSRITFNINCQLFDEEYNFDTNKLFYIRQYPDTELLTISTTTSPSVEMYNSGITKNIISTASNTWTLSANYDNLLLSPPSKIKWNVLLNNVQYFLTGETISLNISGLSSSVTVSAENIQPFYGNFRSYNFLDTINFYNLSSLSALNYISFPENQYFPHKKLDFTNYTESLGFSSLSTCSPERMFLSANGNFSKYIWKLGDITTTSTTNTAFMYVSPDDTSANDALSVSAYDSIVFLERDQVTQFNFASADNSSVFKQKFNFINAPTTSATLELSNSLVDVNKYSTLPTLYFNLDNSLEIIDYNFNIVLSSIDSIQTKNITGYSKNDNAFIDIGLNNRSFLIANNSFNVFNTFLSGSINYKHPILNCSFKESITSDMLSISAFTYPSLTLYTQTPKVSTSEDLSITIQHIDKFDNTFIEVSAINFYDGSSSTLLNVASTFSINYASEGIFSPQLTAYLTNGENIQFTFNNFIFVSDSVEEYNSDIITDFSYLEYPYDSNACKVLANSWQYASNINDVIDRFKTNFDYLTSKCKVYDLTFPYTSSGIYGYLDGELGWHFENLSVDFDELLNIKCADLYENKIYFIDTNNYLNIIDIETNSQILKINKINNLNTIGNIIDIKVTEDNIFLLNGESKTFYVLTNASIPELIYYWGGLGGFDAKTKFINPISFEILNNNIHILDAGTRCIKIYNSNYQWITTISLDFIEEEIIDFSLTPETISVTGKSKIYFINQGASLTDFDIISSKTILNTNNFGIFYIVNEAGISKYTLNGQFINTLNINDIVDVISKDDRLLIITSQSIVQITDTIRTNSILTPAISSIKAWTDVMLNENEPVSDFVFNDTFKKIHDKISILNSCISGKIVLFKNEYEDITQYSVSAYSADALAPITLLGINEPVCYDTINRTFDYIYNSLEVIKDNTSYSIVYPNNTDDLRWNWKYHYIDRTQKPSLNKNPVSWIELTTNRLTLSNELSSISAWYIVRRGEGGNHSDICWNYQQIQDNSYFPLTWESTEFQNASGHVFTWEDLENNCCDRPEFVFEDKLIICK